MKIMINKKELASALDLTAHVVSKKSINPVLHNVLLQAKNGVLELIATDLEVSVIMQLEAEIIEEGQVTLLNSLLREVTKASLSEKIELSVVDGSNVLVKAVGTSYQATMHSIPSEDFPTINRDELSNAPSLFVKGFLLKEMLEKNIPFAAKDDLRYTFNSVYFEKENLEFRTISSDTKRLALSKSFIDSEMDNFSMLIPIKAAKIIKDVLEGEQQDIEVKIMPKKAGFIYEKAIIISNQIEGNFPDYKMVIPAETKVNIKLNKGQFLDTIKSLVPFLTGDVEKIIFSFKENLLLTYTEETELGKGENSIPIEFSAEPFDIAFSYKFIIDILSSIDEDEIIIKILEPEKPAVFIGKDNDNYLFVSVPMQL